MVRQVKCRKLQDQLDGGESVGMFGSDGMLGRGILAGNGGRIIVGNVGNGGNVAAIGKFGIAGNCDTVG